MALPSFPPFDPFVDEVYVFRHINAWEDNRAVDRATWKLVSPQVSILCLVFREELLLRGEEVKGTIRTDSPSARSSEYQIASAMEAMAEKTEHGRASCPVTVEEPCSSARLVVVVRYMPRGPRRTRPV